MSKLTSRFFSYLFIVLGTITCVLLASTPVAAGPHRPATCGVRDDGLERAVKDLAAVLVLELARDIVRSNEYQSQYQQPPPYAGYQPGPVFHGGQPTFQPQMGYGQPNYGGQPMMGYGQGQPMVIYQQPQYLQQELGPVIIMPGQNQGGFFREVSPGYYKIDRYPTLRLPQGARVLRPWREGYSGVTLHLPN